MIREARMEDIDDIMLIYKKAKQIMIDDGNNNQWLNNYPSKELIKEDIDKKQFYVLERENIIHAVFSFIIGIDKTYLIIEDGKWQSDTPYGTIHRIGSDGKYHGILKEAVEFCLTKIKHIRIDTHKDNNVMNHLLPQLGFKYCGIIYVADGTKRLAYELVEE